MKKFIILTTQRSGSTLLWRYLNEHPKISAHGEMMLMSIRREDSYSTFIQSSIKRKIMHYFDKNKALDKYFLELFRENRYIEAAGFKLMYNQISKSLDKWIIQNKLYIIHLIRENTLKLVLSRETAKIRKLYHANNDLKISPVKVKLNPNRIVDVLKKINTEIEYNKRRYCYNPYMEIKYEDLQCDIAKAARSIYRFLNVDDVKKLNIPLKKINPDSLEDLIQNYEEIREVLIDAKYGKFFDHNNKLKW